MFIVAFLPVSSFLSAQCWYREALLRHRDELISFVAMSWCKFYVLLHHRLRQSSDNGTVEEAPLLELFLNATADECVAIPDPDNSDPTPTQECPASAESDMGLSHYSLVVARGNWFEVFFRRELLTRTGQTSFDSRQSMIGCRVYAMPLRKDMSDYVAARLQTDCVLYVCIHIPMADCPMIEMQELAKRLLEQLHS